MKRLKFKLTLSIALATYLCHPAQVSAQRNVLVSQYYLNPYIVDPAMAGIEKGLKVNGVFNKLMSQGNGSPVTQNLTAAYRKEKTGFGLMLVNDQAGLLRQNRFVGTFAYHLPINQAGESIHFGMSLGVTSQKLDLGELNGNYSDQVISGFSDRKSYLDGDFGLAFTGTRLTLQAAASNLKNLLKKDDLQEIHTSNIFLSAAYRLGNGENSQFSPLLAYRKVDGQKNIWDAGMQLETAKRELFLTALYHTEKRASFGIGFNYLKKYLIYGAYGLSTDQLAGRGSNNFEISLGIKL